MTLRMTLAWAARTLVVLLVMSLAAPVSLLAQRRSRGSIHSATREGSTAHGQGRRATGSTSWDRSGDSATRRTTAETRRGETITGSTTATRDGDELNVNRAVESTSGASRSVSKEIEPGEIERSTTTTDRYGRTARTEGEVDRTGPGTAEFERSVEGPYGQEKEIEGVAGRGYYGRGAVAEVEGGRYGDRYVAAGRYYGGRPWAATLPAGYRPYTYYGRPYYAYGGYYYRPIGGMYVVVPPPYGAYYTTAPVGAIALTVAGTALLYSAGTYYKQSSKQGSVSYEVVPAPAGATITALPAGSATVTVAGTTFYYYANIFYRQTGAQSFEVVAKPAGVTSVAALPADFEPIEAGGVTYFVADGRHYLPYLDPTGQESYIEVSAPVATGTPAVTTKAVPLTVPAGTHLAVRMTTTLDSGKAQAGQIFEGVLDQDLVVTGQVVAAKGTRVQGRVAEARAAGANAAPVLAVQLTGVSSAGRVVPVSTAVVKTEGKASHAGRKLLGGAAVGATIGAIADGGEGAAVGGVIGATAGGVAGAASTREVTLAAGTPLEFTTAEAATFYQQVKVQTGP